MLATTHQPIRAATTTLLLGLLLFTVLLAGGCAKAYVDPAYRQVGYEDLKRRETPVPVRLSTEFQVNGTPKERQSEFLRSKVERFFKSTGLLAPSEEGAALEIVLNNVGDIGAAAAKGFGTGLTFGLIGSTVTDGYILTATYRPVGQEDAFVRSYRHAIHTTIGNKQGPPGLEPLPLPEAFDRVLEDMLLNLSNDLQFEGYL